MDTAHLEHDIFLLMLNLSQLKAPYRIRELFLEAMNSFWAGVSFRFVPISETSDSELIEVATIRYLFGRISVEGNAQSLTSAERALIRNAVSMLAIVLETSAQAKLLADENLRLDLMVQERTLELEHETQAHQEAKAKILQYADIVGKMQIGLHVYHLEDLDDDRTLRLVAANAAAADITGLPLHEILGKTLDETFPHLRAHGIPQHYARVVRTGCPYNLESLPYGDDHLKPMFFSMKAVPIAGQCVAVLFEDITARKKAEEESNRLFNFSVDMLAIAGFDGMFKQLNPAWQQTFDWTDDELRQVPWIEFVHPDDQQATLAAGEQLRLGEPVTGFENRYRCKDGSYRWISWNSFPLLEDQTIFAVARDITEKRRIEAELRDLNADLERRVSERTAALKAANTELESFAYVVSHDLKAPLRGIGHLAQWLSQDYAAVLDPKGQEMLAMLSGRVKRLDALIDGVLQYSRIGRMHETAVPIDLQALIQEIIDLLAPPDTITIDIVTAFPTIVAEKPRLIQVFQNLLSNAIKFMDKSDGRIWLSCEERGEAWVFHVADNGPGIEPQYHERIFHIFQTLAPRDTYESTGIGLALVKKIVEYYGGTIWVESAPEQGSVFSFTLPKSGV